jgi:hypothetical protein
MFVLAVSVFSFRLKTLLDGVPNDVKPAEKDAVANASHPMVVILRSGDKGVAPTKALDDRVDPP